MPDFPSTNPDVPLLRVNKIPAHARIFIYGCGSYGRRLRGYLAAVGHDIAGYVDTHRSGIQDGVPVHDLAGYRQRALPDDIVFLGSSFGAEIIGAIRRTGPAINLTVLMPPGRDDGVTDAAIERYQRLQDLILALPHDLSEADAYRAAEAFFRELVPDAVIGEEAKLWWQDKRFIAEMDRLSSGNKRAYERKYVVRQFVESVRHLPGDMAECGTYDGATAYVMARATADVGVHRQLHLFDSFEGLSQPGAADGTAWAAGELAMAEVVARRNLAAFDNIFYYKGWIPDRFKEVADRQFVAVHVDVDLYEPTLRSFEFFYPRLLSGGVIICDDYGFSKCPGAWQAVEEYMAGKPESILHLPTGQGVVIRR